jgi:hypothetical protein
VGSRLQTGRGDSVLFCALYGKTRGKNAILGLGFFRDRMLCRVSFPDAFRAGFGVFSGVDMSAMDAGARGVRACATVAAGLRADTGWLNGAARIVTYEPGNGTRYTVVFTRVRTTAEERFDLHFSLPDAFVVVSWLVEGKSMILVDGPFENDLHWSYVQEKLRCTAPTAVVLAELFAHVLPGRKAVTSEEWLEQMENRGKEHG